MKVYQHLYKLDYSKLSNINPDDFEIVLSEFLLNQNITLSSKDAYYKMTFKANEDEDPIDIKIQIF